MIEIWKIGVACAVVVIACLLSLSCSRSAYDYNEAAAWESYRQAYGDCKTLTTYDDCMRRERWKP